MISHAPCRATRLPLYSVNEIRWRAWFRFALARTAAPFGSAALLKVSPLFPADLVAPRMI
ncbi:hypothetical protein CR492_11595 [Methylocella silvestris]|uniref:Uncharacterized protein n=1 Tax=Methylocella silvestris TaxID=199596 RepID=A0A2J7TG74_METSI|nr:hypothetical protein CR492_11595 [Methylocella silvestris]